MKVDPWQHAMLSVSLTLVMGGLLFGLLVWPALSSRLAFIERLEALHFQYQQFTRAAAHTETLERELEELAGLEANRDGFLEDKPKALAAADLQQLVQSRVEETGGLLISTQVLQGADNEDIFPAITVKVHLRATIESLQQLLHGIEAGQPLLVVDNLSVQRRQRDNRQSRRDGGELEIRFDMTAFIYRDHTHET